MSEDSDDSFLRAIAADSVIDAPEAMPDRVGRFVIERELGRGGMGIVYSAHDERLGRSVALKVLGKRRERDAERRQRFLREARSAASIVHPNVAAVYEVGEADGALYIAMELVAGKSLRQRLAEGALPVVEAVALAAGVARGLAAAHDKQIVHRDLKPENVMVEPSGSPKILDFGLAKLHDADVTPTVLGAQATRSPSTEDGRILGTPGYMSPEQAAGRAIDGRSDLFSLGVVLYEMLAGRLPFSFGTTAEALAAVLRDDPAPLRRVPPAVATLTMQCLAKSPANRPADARAVAARLEEKASSPRSRTPLFAGAAAIAIVGAGIALRASGPSASAPAPIASAVPDAATERGVAIDAVLMPHSNVPAAAAAYAAGLTSLRDGAWELGAFSFVRAAKLDPTFAAAHLRVALYGSIYCGVLPSQSREAAATAMRFRASLDARDLALLRVVEAANREPSDMAEVLERVREAASRYPRDVEVVAQLGMTLRWVEKLDEARVQLNHALDLDPEFAGALSLLAYHEYWFRKDEAALALYGRCLALSPVAGSCVRWRAEIHEARGECAALEADARQLVQIEPTSPSSYELLARALAGRDAPIESVKLALDRMVAFGSDLSPLYGASIAKYWLALFDGDLTAAETALLETDRALTGELSGEVHEGIIDALTKLAVERGETPAAAARFYAGVERVNAARSADSPWGLRTIRLYESHRAKRIGDAEFEKERDRRFEESQSFDPAPRGSIFYDRGWISVFIEPAITKAEILDSLGKLDAYGPIHDEWGLTGRLYLDAGRFDDAIAVLRPAAARCEAIPRTSWAVAPTTWWSLDTHRQLGEALEAKGDKPGACDAYGVIAARWKNAKPRSVTLEKAKERMRALGCGH